MNFKLGQKSADLLKEQIGVDKVNKETNKRRKQEYKGPCDLNVDSGESPKECELTFTKEYKKNMGIVYLGSTYYKFSPVNRAVFFVTSADISLPSVEKTPSEEEEDKPITLKPKFKFKSDVKESFGNSIITPTRMLDGIITVRAKMFRNNINKLFRDIKNFDAKIEETDKDIIEMFIKNGFVVEGHADGSPPSKVTDKIKSDHGGEAFDGITDLYERNNWLAEKRAKNLFNLFINKLENLEKWGIDDEAKNYLINTLKLQENGGKSTLKIVNHLNTDGTINKGEIGPQYRSMNFIPDFNETITLNREIKIKEPVESKLLKKELEPKETKIKHNGKEIDAFRTTDGKYTYIGVENLDGIPKITNTTFDGSSKIFIGTKDGIFGINNYRLGQIRPTGGMESNQLTTPDNSLWCYIEELSYKFEEGGKVYKKLYPFMLAFTRLY